MDMPTSDFVRACGRSELRAEGRIVLHGRHSTRQGATGPPPTAFSGRFAQPICITITQSKASRPGGHRTSFAPETIATRRNKHDRTRQICRKINASGSCPVAHNGLVAGSSPAGPTNNINSL
jgi:hypothetical protein